MKFTVLCTVCFFDFVFRSLPGSDINLEMQIRYTDAGDLIWYYVYKLQVLVLLVGFIND